MEGRRSIHHHRNTVSPAQPTKKQRQARHSGYYGSVVDAGPIIPENKTVKHCAVLECVWCHFRSKNYFAVCPRCRNCQICGLLVETGYSCPHCGNILDPELAKKLTPRIQRMG